MAEGLLQALAWRGARVDRADDGLLGVPRRYGPVVVDAFGLADVQFLPWTWIALVLLVSAVLGALAGRSAAAVARALSVGRAPGSAASSAH